MSLLANAGNPQPKYLSSNFCFFEQESRCKVLKKGILHLHFALFEAKLHFSGASPKKCKLLLWGYERCPKKHSFGFSVYFPCALLIVFKEYRILLPVYFDIVL